MENNSSSDSNDRFAIESLVKENLAYFQYWKEVQLEDKTMPWRGTELKLVSGIPPNKLSNDDPEIIKEYILPVNMTQYKEEFITLQCLDLVFENLCEKDTKRIILGIVNSDGTLVFYFIYKGIHKPKKN
ncbi:tRNA-splicing endonuclease subunit Sen15p [Monosporozyma unispora]|nr:tRNA splicing endonuclease subunit [Kazachstania unispora]